MPTRYWLVRPGAVQAVARLESAGGVRAAEAAVDPDELAAAHAAYAAERDGAIDPAPRRPPAVRRGGGNEARGEVPPRPLRLLPGRRRRPGRALGGGDGRPRAES